MAPSTVHRVALSAVKSATSTLTKRNPARKKKPSPLPLRPLEPDRFRPPRGEKQIFLPNFTLALLRGSPHQPANQASFLVPLWLNKLDLKDYLYNLYSVRTLSIRSYIIHGKVRREPRTGQLHRQSQKKKMTIEMERGDDFVWPDVPKDLEPWDKGLQDRMTESKKERMEGVSGQGTDLRKVGQEERVGLRERARQLLEGRVRWRPGWEESGGGMVPTGGEARPSASI